MEKALKELQNRIASLEAKLSALPSPEEFAALKSDVESLKSDAAPRATSTAEAALKVAYDMKADLAEKADSQSMDSLRQEIESLKVRERGAAPAQGHLQNVIQYLRRRQSMFDRQVIVRTSTNDWYKCLKQPSRWYMFCNVGNSYRIDIVLKDPVRVNGLKLFRPMKEFDKPVVISLGEHQFQQNYQVELSRPKKKKEEVGNVESKFDTKMVRWVRLEPHDWDAHDWITYNIELYSPDPMYANGVFATLGQMNKDMRNVCKFIVQAYASSHEELPRKRFTFQEQAPWIEVEIVHGRLKLTGYSVAWSNTNFPRLDVAGLG